MSESENELSIEIFSDVICPWCFIGKRRLDRALEHFRTQADGLPVSLRWRPYQLYPNIPDEGLNRAQLLQAKYGPQADAGRVPQQIDQEASAEQINLRFDLINVTPNTLQAHCLLECAFEQGGAALQHPLAERLFLAYFCEGRDIGSLAVLLSIAGEAGLDISHCETYMHRGEALPEVRSQLARAPDVGVSGVPGYYLANGFLLPGAQTAETMTQILTRVHSRLVERAKSASVAQTEG